MSKCAYSQSSLFEPEFEGRVINIRKSEVVRPELPALTSQEMDTSQWAPTIAGQDTLQQQAATLAGTQGKGIGAYEDYLTAAAPYSGPDAYKQFMAPYQQQVIDATMSSFDKQAAQQRRGISDQAKQV